MANEWYLSATGGYRGLGLIGQNDVYPAYSVYQLYEMFENELVYSSSDDPDLSIYAARRTDGAVTVIVINLSPEEKTKPIQIEGQTEAQADTWLFDPDHRAENMGAVQLSKEIILPSQSMTHYSIEQLLFSVRNGLTSL